MFMVDNIGSLDGLSVISKRVNTQPSNEFAYRRVNRLGNSCN